VSPVPGERRFVRSIVGVVLRRPRRSRRQWQAPLHAIPPETGCHSNWQVRIAASWPA